MAMAIFVSFAAAILFYGSASAQSTPHCFDDYDAQCVKGGDSIVDKMAPCNSCYCTKRGYLTCTISECPIPGCLHRGRVWNYGQTFQDPVSCNKCQCGLNGKLKCTDEVCPKVYCRHGRQFFYPGDKFPAKDCCNICRCDARGRILCTKDSDCSKRRRE